jgi:hypothetical protein
VEERVRVAQDELRQREIEKERNKRELKAKTTSEQMSVLQVLRSIIRALLRLYYGISLLTLY